MRDVPRVLESLDNTPSVFAQKQVSTASPRCPSYRLGARLNGRHNLSGIPTSPNCSHRVVPNLATYGTS